jgi:ABC-type nitrate/sulfonate/bicarbonate transport system permease component
MIAHLIEAHSRDVLAFLIGAAVGVCACVLAGWRTVIDVTIKHEE